jgi:hypothetical protein
VLDAMALGEHLSAGLRSGASCGTRARRG